MGYSINVLAPSNSAELAEALRDAAAAGRTISLAGNSTKRRMAGPVEPADVALTTLSLRGVLQYEPRDLTISVNAGAELVRVHASAGGEPADGAARPAVCAMAPPWAE